MIFVDGLPVSGWAAKRRPGTDFATYQRTLIIFMEKHWSDRLKDVFGRLPKLENQDPRWQKKQKHRDPPKTSSFYFIFDGLG